MHNPDTNTAAVTCVRNASLLSAVALLLAFALGVGGMSVSFDAAAQQLLPDDDASSLLADLPEPHDPIIVAQRALQHFAAWAPVFGGLPRVVSIENTGPHHFLARAPPLTC